MSTENICNDLLSTEGNNVALDNVRYKVYNRACVGDVAQLGEHQVRNLRVGSSILLVSTINIRTPQGVCGLKRIPPSPPTIKKISRREFKASAFYVALNKKFADITADDFFLSLFNFLALLPRTRSSNRPLSILPKKFYQPRPSLLIMGT